jgi:peptide/nickel transport system substrate-binding protein
MSTSLRLLAGAAFALAALTQPTTAQAPRTLTMLGDIDADRYDPHRTAARAAGEVVYLLADTLVALDFDQKTIVPGLATSWTVSPDGKLYTFKLRDDVTFCDGRKMVADDVAFSIKRWIDPATRSPVRWRAGDVKDVRAVDATTVAYELNQPNSELLYQLTLYFASVIDRNEVEKLGADFGVKGMNGTGPYCWVSWEPRNEVVMRRHAAYKWGPPIYKNRGPAHYDRVVRKVVPEEATRLAGVMSGQADITQFAPFYAIEQIKRNRNLQLHQAENYFWLYFIGFKVDKPTVSDPRVRRALNMAVDQRAIADALFFGQARPARTYVDPRTLDYYPGVEAAIPPYDPEGAKKLLDEAGWKVGADGFRSKDGVKLAPLTYAIAGNWQKYLEAVQGDLRKIGVDLQLQLFDATIAWGKLATQEFDAFGMSFPYFSAGDAMNLYFRSANVPTPNRMNWKDAETDRLLDAGRSALTDAARSAAYAQVQKRVMEESVWIPIVHEPLFLTASARLDGVRAHGIYGVGIYKGLDLAPRR